MWAAVTVGVVMVGLIAIAIVLYYLNREPKTDKEQIHDDPLYRELIIFTRHVAYYNDTIDGWKLEDIVPSALAQEAKQLLTKYKKELQA